MDIRKLSMSNPNHANDGSSVVIVGSFAPVHRGHFDAIRAASRAVSEQIEPVGSIILSPNSDEYLARKLRGKGEELSWTYDRRIDAILEQSAPVEGVPTFVDDITGRYIGLEEINFEVPHTLRHSLGLAANRLFFVTGSDQLPSMQLHLQNPDNRSVCVLRPGHMEALNEQLQQDWVVRAVQEGRYIITEREDMVNDISSTNIRRSA